MQTLWSKGANESCSCNTTKNLRYNQHNRSKWRHNSCDYQRKRNGGVKQGARNAKENPYVDYKSDTKCKGYEQEIRSASQDAPIGSCLTSGWKVGNVGCRKSHEQKHSRSNVLATLL